MLIESQKLHLDTIMRIQERAHFGRHFSRIAAIYRERVCTHAEASLSQLVWLARPS